MPGWPFATYVWLTLARLAALGTGLLLAGFQGWTGWVTLSACLAYLIVHVRLRDIPPFAFYTLLPVASIGWL